jgi:hypothetical protein
MTPRLLITEATGFVGKAVCELAVHSGLAVKGALRVRVDVSGCMESFVLDEIIYATD